MFNYSNFVILGIGNKGDKYQWTRHNIGFLVIDDLIKKNNLSLQEKFQSHYTKMVCEEKKIFLVKPQTYVNLSGESLKELTQFYKIPLQNILIIVDDYALPFGKIRTRFSGSSGGHNGLKSIEKVLGKNYTRLRIGIHNESAEQKEMNHFVLGNFSSKEKEQLQQCFDVAENFILDWLQNKPREKLMTKYNTINFSQKNN